MRATVLSTQFTKRFARSSGKRIEIACRAAYAMPDRPTAQGRRPSSTDDGGLTGRRSNLLGERTHAPATAASVKRAWFAPSNQPAVSDLNALESFTPHGERRGYAPRSCVVLRGIGRD